MLSPSRVRRPGSSTNGCALPSMRYIEYLHHLYATFEHEPKTKPESGTHPPMTTWDRLDEEVRSFLLPPTHTPHLSFTSPSLHFTPNPSPHLDNPNDLLTYFLPTVTNLPLQPFPLEQY